MPARCPCPFPVWSRLWFVWWHHNVARVIAEAQALILAGEQGKRARCRLNLSLPPDDTTVSQYLATAAQQHPTNGAPE